MDCTPLNKSARLHLVVFSDSHGRLISAINPNNGEPIYGLDRLATYLKRLKATGETVLTIDNGDSIQGTPLVDLWVTSLKHQALQRHPVSIFHDYIELDCFIPGNHEFNFGIEHLLKIKKESQAAWLSANVVQKDMSNKDELLFQPYKLFCFGELRIGIIGLVTDFVPKWESADSVDKLEFKNVIDVCELYIPIVRKICDILIVSYHGGLKADPATGESWSIGDTSENQGLDLWNRFPEIDLLITGHQHRSYLYFPQRMKHAIIIQPSSYARQWVHLVIEPHQQPDKRVISRMAFSTKASPGVVLAASEVPDLEIEKRLKPHQLYTEAILNTPIGYLDSTFEINDPMQDVWLKKHPLIQWISQLMSTLTGAEITGIPLLSPNLKGMSGTITIRDIVTFFFFQDTVCVIEINGAILKAALEKSADFFKLEKLEPGETKVVINPDWKKNRVLCYNYDIWSGIEYCFDLRRQGGQRLIAIEKNGRPIEDHESLQVAVTSYRAAGAFFEMFSPRQVVRTYSSKITDLMINDLRKNKSVHLETIQNFIIHY